MNAGDCKSAKECFSLANTRQSTVVARTRRHSLQLDAFVENWTIYDREPPPFNGFVKLFFVFRCLLFLFFLHCFQYFCNPHLTVYFVLLFFSWFVLLLEMKPFCFSCRLLFLNGMQMGVFVSYFDTFKRVTYSSR